jgi:hypothetical protein
MISITVNSVYWKQYNQANNYCVYRLHTNLSVSWCGHNLQNLVASIKEALLTKEKNAFLSQFNQRNKQGN